MLFRLVPFYSFAFFLLITYILATSHSIVSQSVIINFICGRTSYPVFCKKALYSDSRSEMASSAVAGVISIDLTIRNASAIIPLVKYGIQRTSSSSLRDRLEACNTTSHTVVNYMHQAEIFWRNKNFHKTKNIATRSTRALNAVCTYRLKKTMNGLLWKEIQILLRLLHIVVAVCDFALIPIN